MEEQSSSPKSRPDPHGFRQPDIGLPLPLFQLLKDAKVGHQLTHSLAEFVTDAVRHYLPNDYDGFGTRAGRGTGLLTVRPKLPASIHKRVSDLSAARKDIIVIQKNKSDDAAPDERPMIRYFSIRAIYEEVIARKIACECRAYGFLESDHPRIERVTGFNPGTISLLNALRRTLKHAPTAPAGDPASQPIVNTKIDAISHVVTEIERLGHSDGQLGRSRKKQRKKR